MNDLEEFRAMLNAVRRTNFDNGVVAERERIIALLGTTLVAKYEQTIHDCQFILPDGNRVIDTATLLIAERELREGFIALIKGENK